MYFNSLPGCSCFINFVNEKCKEHDRITLNLNPSNGKFDGLLAKHQISHYFPPSINYALQYFTTIIMLMCVVTLMSSLKMLSWLICFPLT